MTSLIYNVKYHCGYWLVLDCRDRSRSWETSYCSSQLRYDGRSEWQLRRWWKVDQILNRFYRKLGFSQKNGFKNETVINKTKTVVQNRQISHNVFLGSLMDTIYIDIEITVKYVSGKWDAIYLVEGRKGRSVKELNHI